MPKNVRLHSPRTPPLLPTLDIGEATDEPFRRNVKACPLTSSVKGVTNRTERTSFTDCSSLIGSPPTWDDDDDDDDGACVPLTEVLHDGSELRLQAQSLYTSPADEPTPCKWRGGLLKRSLVGLGILTGAGVLTGAGYVYFAGRNNMPGQTGTSAQPNSTELPHGPAMPHERSDGYLEPKTNLYALTSALASSPVSTRTEDRTTLSTELTPEKPDSFHTLALSQASEMSSFWTVCAGAGTIYSCSFNGWGTIEITIDGFFGAAVVSGKGYINKDAIEKNYSSGKTFSNDKVSGSLDLFVLGSVLTGRNDQGVKLFNVYSGGFGALGGGQIKTITFIY